MRHPSQLGSKIERLCQQKQLTLRALCQISDLKYQTLHAQISHQRNIPFETIRKISDATGVALDWFASDEDSIKLSTPELNALSGNLIDQVIQSTKLHRANEERILDAHSLTLIYYRSGGLLSALAPFLEQVDVYFAPKQDETRLRLYRMGSDSLTSRTLRRTDPQQLQKSLDNAPKTLRDSFLADYKRVASGEFLYSIETLDAFAADHKERIRLDYLRLLIRFESEEDGAVIVNLSELLR